MHNLWPCIKWDYIETGAGRFGGHVIGFISTPGYEPSPDSEPNENHAGMIRDTWFSEVSPDQLEFTFPIHDWKYCRGQMTCPWHALAEACQLLMDECEMIAK